MQSLQSKRVTGDGTGLYNYYILRNLYLLLDHPLYVAYSRDELCVWVMQLSSFEANSWRMIHLRTFSHQQFQQLKGCMTQVRKVGIGEWRDGDTPEWQFLHQQIYFCHIMSSGSTSSGILVGLSSQENLQEQYLWMHSSGPTTVADLESTTDVHHLLPLLHILDPTQPWLASMLVLCSLPSQVTQTVILRETYPVITIPFSDHGCFACQFPIKFGSGDTERFDHGSLGCQIYSLLPRGLEAALSSDNQSQSLQPGW